MRKMIFTALAGFFILVLATCGSSASPANNDAIAQRAQGRSDGTTGTPAPSQSADTGNPYFTGDGGQGKSIAILIPTGSGLTPEQNYLPALVQGVLVQDLGKYSSMQVLDRQSLDNVVAETESGIYQNEEDFIKFGEVANVGYALTGDIVKTTTGYNLTIKVTDAKTGVSAASYSGACTVAELDNHTGIKKASMELLERMGIRLTDNAKSELGKADSQNAINAQTALARGIIAQKGGTIVEAMSYYNRAASFDPSLLEASSRVSVMSASISGGDIGENVRGEIALRNEWARIMQEADAFFTEHPPYEIIYNPNLTQGTINYEQETAIIETSVSVIATSNYNIIRDLEQGLEKARAGKPWRIQGIKKDWSAPFEIALLNESGRTLSALKGYVESPNSYNRGIDTKRIPFEVKASDINGVMRISFITVNGMDMQTIEARNYMSVSPFDLTVIADMGLGCEWDGGAITITSLTSRFNGVFPERIDRWPVVAVNARTLRNSLSRNNLKFSSLTIPLFMTEIDAQLFANRGIASLTLHPGITSIGSGAFRENELTSVVIPPCVKTIEARAFAYNNLKTITIGENVEIDSAAFLGNNDEQSINDGRNFIHSYQLFGRKAGTYTFDASLVNLGPNFKAQDQLTPAWSLNGAESALYTLSANGSLTIPPGHTIIRNKTFYGKELTSVVIPSSVKSIEAGAFANNKIKTITIGVDVAIDNTAFLNNNSEDSDPEGYGNFSKRYEANNRRAGTYTFRKIPIWGAEWSFNPAR